MVTENLQHLLTKIHCALYIKLMKRNTPLEFLNVLINWCSGERERIYLPSQTMKQIIVNNTKYSGRLPEKHKPINAGRL